MTTRESIAHVASSEQVLISCHKSNARRGACSRTKRIASLVRLTAISTQTRRPLYILYANHLRALTDGCPS